MGLEKIAGVSSSDDATHVSKVLSDGESTTVPSGKKWAVVINTSPAAAGSGRATFGNYGAAEEELVNDASYIKIDGVIVAGTEATSEAAFSDMGNASGTASASSTSTVPYTAFLTENQTVSASGGGAHITGKEYDA